MTAEYRNKIKFRNYANPYILNINHVSNNEIYNGQNYDNNFNTARKTLIPWIKINLSGNSPLSLCYEFARSCTA